MSKKITITEKQAAQFNQMRATLKKIWKDYMTTEQIARGHEKEGLDHIEMLEMAYQNIQGEAANAVSGVRPIRMDETQP